MDSPTTRTAGNMVLRFLEQPLSRRVYALVGVNLMLLKYVVEWLVITQTTGREYAPLDFVNPLLGSRLALLRGGPPWLGYAWIVWTIPFLIIAMALTVRRSLDAGWSPWTAMTVLVPVLNLVIMVVLALVPAQARGTTDDGTDAAPPTAARELYLEDPQQRSALASGAFGALAAVVYSFVMLCIFIYGFDSYGATLFFGLPIVAGAAAGYWFNIDGPRSWLSTIGVAMLPAVIVGALLLVFAIEGLVCLLMAVPLMLPLSLVGGVLGKSFAAVQRDRRPLRSVTMCLAALPMLAYGESRLPHDIEFCVTSSVDVQAAPEEVWPHVVDFPPITSRPPWLFRMGIAGPQGARIDGRGVGAIRRCDFTTGSFVEPITAWDEPRRLAFDVTEQPDPMTELSPYRHVHPPHLDGAFRSTRGEFVLQPLEGGRTRLVGRTWYRLELAPLPYWTIWSDWIIHRIHHRVLDHVKELAERDDPQTEP